jgi:hypothetical protein
MHERLGYITVVSVVALATPLEKKLPPHRETEGSDYWDLFYGLLSLVWGVELIDKPILFKVDLCPDRLSPLRKLERLPIPFTIAHESAILIGINFICQEKHEILIILEMHWELYQQLPDTL